MGKNSWSGNYSCPWFLLVGFSFFVAGDNGFYVTRTAVAQLKSVPGKDFMEWVGFRKVVINDWKEAFTYFGFYILTVWRIEPPYVRVLVCPFGFVKTFVVRWYFRKTLVDWFRDISQNRVWVVGLSMYIQRYISLFSEWKGRCFPVFRLRVTSKKLTLVRLASTLIFRSLSRKILQINVFELVRLQRYVCMYVCMYV